MSLPTGEPFQRDTIKDSKYGATPRQEPRKVVDVSQNVIDVLLLGARANSVTQSTENPIAEVLVEVDCDFDVAGQGCARVLEKSLDAEIAGTFTPLEMGYF